MSEAAVPAIRDRFRRKGVDAARDGAGARLKPTLSWPHPMALGVGAIRCGQDRVGFSGAPAPSCPPWCRPFLAPAIDQRFLVDRDLRPGFLGRILFRRPCRPVATDCEILALQVIKRGARLSSAGRKWSCPRWWCRRPLTAFSSHRGDLG